MSVYKMVDVVGTSSTSVSDAVRAAVQRASQTLDDLQWFEVKEIRGRLTEGEISEYQVKVEIGFLLHAASKETGEGTKSAAARATGSREARSTAAQVAAKRGEHKRADLARGFEKQPKGQSRRAGRT